MLGRHIHSHLVDIKLETQNQLIRKEKGYHKPHMPLIRINHLMSQTTATWTN